MIIEAFIDCHPKTATAQHKGARALDVAGKPGRHKIVFFEKDDVEAAHAQLVEHFTRHAPPAVLAGPLKFTAVWTFYWNKGELKKRKKDQLPEWVPMIVWPDGDNLAKLLKDVFTELGYWSNDAHVSCETYIRGRGDRPGIHIRVEPYRPADWYQLPEGDVAGEIEL